MCAVDRRQALLYACGVAGCGCGLIAPRTLYSSSR